MFPVLCLPYCLPTGRKVPAHIKTEQYFLTPTRTVVLGLWFGEIASRVAGRCRVSDSDG